MEVCTEKLLEECSQGCKMAINSINQIQEHIENDRLSDVVSRYKKKAQGTGERGGCSSGGRRKGGTLREGSRVRYVMDYYKCKTYDG